MSVRARSNAQNLAHFGANSLAVRQNGAVAFAAAPFCLFLRNENHVRRRSPFLPLRSVADVGSGSEQRAEPCALRRKFTRGAPERSRGFCRGSVLFVHEGREPHPQAENAPPFRSVADVGSGSKQRAEPCALRRKFTRGAPKKESREQAFICPHGSLFYRKQIKSVSTPTPVPRCRSCDDRCSDNRQPFRFAMTGPRFTSSAESF